MTNKIEETKIKATKMVPAGSRYELNKVIYYGEEKYLTFPLYRRPSVTIGNRDKYTVINKSTEYRPDLVSQDFYGTSIYWWKVMEANNIRDIWDFKAGLSIWIPESFT